MITLATIDAMFPKTHDGSVYSDLYKDVYGSRPRYASFDSLEDFHSEYAYLVGQISKVLDRERQEQATALAAFIARVTETMELVQGTDAVRAIEIIADAEGEAESMKFYGYESLEYALGLQFGAIKSWLETK